MEITRLLLKLLVSVVPKQPQCVNEYDCSNKTLFTQWVCWPTGHVRWQVFIYKMQVTRWWQRTDQHWPEEAGAVSKLREGLQEEEAAGSDPDTHTFHCNDGFASVYMCQLIKLYMLNTCSLLYVNYTSIKLLTKSKAQNSKMIFHIHL